MFVLAPMGNPFSSEFSLNLTINNLPMIGLKVFGPRICDDLLEHHKLEAVKVRFPPKVLEDLQDIARCKSPDVPGEAPKL